MQRPGQAQRRARLSIFCLWVLIALLVQGCTALPERNPLPEARQAGSRVPGTPHLRFWADEPHPAYADLVDPTSEKLQAIVPGMVGRELNLLAISGGGQNGAFAAGLLTGWTASGTRPTFNAVTGISAGALIAPFAYLGPDYDPVVEQIYTQHSTEDLIKRRSQLWAMMTDAAFDTAPLRALLAEYFDESVVQAMAAEHTRGRLLYIGTTNLDVGPQLTWDIGSIASSARPGALGLILDIIPASASIPFAFPPVMIEVGMNGETFDEMHVDGGVTRQAFLFNLSTEADTFQRLKIIGRGQAYVIRNSKRESTWEPVDRRIFSIAARSASSMIRTQGIGDLYREYLGAKKYDFDFHLARIRDDFDAESHEPFDSTDMREFYKLGYKMAADGYP